MLKLANTVLILINPSPSNVNSREKNSIKSEREKKAQSTPYSLVFPSLTWRNRRDWFPELRDEKKKLDKIWERKKN